jgi:hypothetical protein
MHEVYWLVGLFMSSAEPRGNDLCSRCGVGQSRSAAPGSAWPPGAGENARASVSVLQH